MNFGLRLRVFLAILVGLMVIGTLGFMITEGLTFTDSLYFSIVTVATVGYGDISPVTAGGKILSIFLIVTGVGTFLGVVANATELILSKEEHKMRMEKLNMVIGSFYSEAGTELLKFFVEHDRSVDKIRNALVITSAWTKDQFAAAGQHVKDHEFLTEIEKIDLQNLRTVLQEKGGFFLRLLENPSIFDHETFTDLLRAFLHLKEELHYRDDLSALPETDLGHLSGDLNRAYRLLVIQWVDHMKYLKDHYPYLFSLAARTNPFDRTSSVIITE